MQFYFLHMRKTDCIVSKISMRDTTRNLHPKQLNSRYASLKISVYLRLLHYYWLYTITPTHMHMHMLFLSLQLALLLTQIGTCSQALTVFMPALRACKHFVLRARVTIAGQRSNILQCPCVCVSVQSGRHHLYLLVANCENASLFTRHNRTAPPGQLEPV